MLDSLFSNVTDLKACNFIKKENPTPVFSCEYCDIFKNSYFEQHLETAAYAFPCFFEGNKSKFIVAQLILRSYLFLEICLR